MEYNDSISDLERRIFELILFNTLILDSEEYYSENEEYSSEYPESFWDHVIVSLNDELINSGLIDVSEECTICTNNNTRFKLLPCCDNVICVECNISWFSLSVYCPYCKHDLRNET